MFLLTEREFCMGESRPRSPIQTERSELCTSDRGQYSPIKTDLARLIRCLLYGQTRKLCWKLCWKPRKVIGSFSVPFCLRSEMKNLDTRRSSLLAGMFSIALDSFSDSQNFFHAFKSLLVLYWVFFISAPAEISQFWLHLLLVASSAGFQLANVCSFSLPGSSWRSTDSSI